MVCCVPEPSGPEEEHDGEDGRRVGDQGQGGAQVLQVILPNYTPDIGIR